MTPREKLAAGRLIARQQAPWFRSALHALIPREAPGLDTMGVTDSAILMWDPAAVQRWKPEEVAGVLIHEISHLLRDHSARRRAIAADPRLWNIAGDCEINDDLSRYKIPGEGCFPKTFGMQPGKLAESYYAELRRQGKGQGGEGGEGAEGDGKAIGPGKPSAAGGWCGSGAGRAVPGEPEQLDEKGKPQGRSPREIERVRRETAKAIQEQASRGQGSMAAGWLRWANEELKPPRIPWQRRLATLARSAAAYASGAVDYKYDRPARRQSAIGWGPGKPILAALRRPIIQAAIVLDTSGSMGSAELSVALAESDGIMRAVGANVTFCACDAEVHSLKQVRTWRELIPLVKGGGGTDFRPAFEEISRRRPRPDVLIFFTDGYGSAPALPPNFRTIWVLINSKHRPTTWGDYVEIDTTSQGDDR